MGGFQAAKEKAPSPKKREKRPQDIFPQLSCLNKDEMLSHAMVVPVKQGCLTIGKSAASGEANSFEIDGEEARIKPRPHTRSCLRILLALVALFQNMAYKIL